MLDSFVTAGKDRLELTLPLPRAKSSRLWPRIQSLWVHEVDADSDTMSVKIEGRCKTSWSLGKSVA
jgi:hypothetical protein